MADFSIPDFSIVRDGVIVNVKFSRYKEQFKRAQYQLDGDVMNSMIPFMPHVNGTFIQVTRAQSSAVQGSGIVYAAYGAQGRFLYEGKGMIDPETGSTWAKRGHKKVLVSEYRGRTNAKENLSYNHIGHPEAQARWFDAAKERDCDKWVKTVKEIAGGG